MLPYGVIYHRNDGANIELREVDIKNGTLNYTDNIVVRECKPYLRPMSSMTEEERKEYESIFSIGEYSCGGSLEGKEYEYINDSYDDVTQSVFLIDWLLAHHFDFRKLIQKGLALEATERMYKTK